MKQILTTHPSLKNVKYDQVSTISLFEQISQGQKL